jgi:DNA helicase II / ATP-dependent DNA helicase PcrA
MRVVADLHVHSRFSRACSQLLTLENNALWCHKKGVNVLGTGDFTHPEWFKEIESQLVDAEPGMYRLASENNPDVRFVMTSEVSQIYKRGGKTRRIHNLIFAPSRDVARRINAWLVESGFNVKSDGRPILGIDSEELYKRLKEIDNDIVLCPAHVWTPWFALFGSKSGFDSIEECFGEMAKEVFVLETGLSSDPYMNRSWSHLDRVVLISNSDAHSPQNFGREANVFNIPETDLSFASLINAIKTRDAKQFLYTIEFFPEEGKYHIDGHAQCGFSCEPAETKRLGGKCPMCGGAITVGVLSRVEQLADRARKKEVMDGHVPYKSIIPLPELIGLALGKRSVAKKVQEIYEQMITNGGNEFSLLLDASVQDLCALSDERIADAIVHMREGDVSWCAGYDGVFGKPQFKKNVRMQEALL